MRARVTVSLAGVMVLGTLAACSPGADTPSPAPGAEVDLGAPVAVSQGADWQTMDLQVSDPSYGWWMTGGYDRLTAIYNGEVVPYLADSWEIADDNTSITFQLGEGAVCQDGTPVTPQVVADSFERLFTVEKTSLNLTQFWGAGPLTVSADDEAGTVTITTETPYRALAEGAASGSASIICPAGLADPEALQDGFFGSGPYALESAVHADSVVLTKNPEWTWGPLVDGKRVTAADLPDQQTWKIMSDMSAIANALQTGQLDGGRLSGPEVKRFRDNADFNVEELVMNFPLVMDFVQGPHNPTSDPALRQALSRMIEPESFARAYNTDGSTITLVTSFIDPSNACYDATTEQLYPTGGVDEAKQILEDAGYTGVGSTLVAPDGTPVALRLVTNASQAGQVGEYLLQAFQPLGADVELFNLDTQSGSQMTFSGQAEVAVSIGAGTVKDPTQSIIGYFAGQQPAEGGLNLFGPSPAQDPVWNQLIDEGRASADCEPWKAAQRHALEQAILLPIAQGIQNRVTNADTVMFSGFYNYEPWIIRNAG